MGCWRGTSPFQWDGLERGQHPGIWGPKYQEGPQNHPHPQPQEPLASLNSNSFPGFRERSASCQPQLPPEKATLLDHLACWESPALLVTPPMVPTQPSAPGLELPGPTMALQCSQGSVTMSSVACLALDQHSCLSTLSHLTSSTSPHCLLNGQEPGDCVPGLPLSHTRYVALDTSHDICSSGR